MSFNSIGWERFLDEYKPEKNTMVEGAPEDGYMFETYGVEFEYVRKHDAYNVWTIVDAEGDEVILNGFHYVNRLGYIITKVKWKEGEEIEVQV